MYHSNGVASLFNKFFGSFYITNPKDITERRSSCSIRAFYTNEAVKSSDIFESDQKTVALNKKTDKLTD